jgi:hypothetical protein
MMVGAIGPIGKFDVSDGTRIALFDDDITVVRETLQAAPSTWPGNPCG